MITITEEITVPAPRERVWAVVSSPPDVVACINGAELGASHEDGSFDGALVVRFAGVRVRFAARVRLELTESEFEGRLSAQGGDGQGATRFRSEATFNVIEDEATGGSQVTMRGRVELNGKLASLIESGAGVVVAKMTREFSAQLIQRCTEPTVEPAAGAVIAAPAEAHPATLPEESPAGPPAGVPVGTGQPVAPRRGWLRAWLARLFHRRRPAPAAPTGSSSPYPTRPEEVGSGSAQAQ